jgi:hypothetical protein
MNVHKFHAALFSTSLSQLGWAVTSQRSGCTHIRQTSPKSLNEWCLPARKLMATVFWDRKGVLMAEFMHQGTTVTSEAYCETYVGPAIQNKRHGMLTYGVVLLHDNVRQHTTARTRTLLEHFKWDLFDHLPYSPDLAPKHCHLLTCLKNWLGSQRFNNKELMEGVEMWLSSQMADFFDTGIENLIP